MRTMSIALSCLIAWTTVQQVQANWPQFRGPEGNGFTLEAKLPMQWSADQNILWKVAIPGSGWSSPIVWGDKIFLTAAEADKQDKPQGGEFDPGSVLAPIIPPKAPDVMYRYKVFCLSGTDGKILWQATAHEGKPRTPAHRNNTYASETPATDGKHLIVYFGNTGLYCYDLDGKPLWSKDLGAFATLMGWGTGGSPILRDGRVYLQCDNEKSSFLVAFDVKTGDEIWRVDRDEKTNWSTPYFWRNDLRTELVTAGGAKNRSYNPDNGQLLWELKGSGRTAVSPVGDDRMLFVGSEHRITGVFGSIAAVRAGGSGDITPPDGQRSSEFVAWTLKLEIPRIASPMLVDDNLFIFAEQGGGIYCYDAKTGAERFSQRIPNAAGFTASPLLADGKIYATDERGLTVIFKPGSTFELLGSNTLDGETFWASPAVWGDKFILRGTDHLYCIAQ